MNDYWISRTLETSDRTYEFEFVALSACTMPKNWAAELFPVEEYLVPGRCDSTILPHLLRLQRYQRSWRTRVPWSASQIMELFVDAASGITNDGQDEGNEMYDIDEHSLALPCPPMVNVMLIEWDSRVVRRLGIGKILLSGWLQSEPQVKMIIFE
jgi:hypothetical protein